MQLFLCRTPVQLLRAIHLVMNVEDFKKPSTLCLFNTIKGADQIVERIKKESIFTYSYYMDTGEFLSGGGVAAVKNYYKNTTIKKIINEGNYSRVISFNIETPENFIAYNLLKRKTGFEYYYVEDAPTVYSYRTPGQRAQKIVGLFNLQYPIFYVSKWYFSMPEKMEIQNSNPVITLPKFDRADTAFVEVANRIFAYEEDKDLEEADIVVMEESFFQDGLMKNDKDYRIVNLISQNYRNKKIVVKLHPRTKENRFEDKFTVLKATNIPWELYLLNRSYEDKIFVSIACSTLISQKLLYNDEYRAISLLNLVYEDVLREDGSRYLEGDWENKVRSYHEYYDHREYIYIPESEKDLFIKLDEWLKQEVE